MTRLLLAASLILTSTSARAQGVQFPYEKVLVPILGHEIPGAHGSLWNAELLARNESDQFVEIANVIGGCMIECPPGWPPHATFGLNSFVPNPNAGEFLYIGAPGAGKVTISLRILDISRQSQTWGTMIPVVRERDVYNSGSSNRASGSYRPE